MSYDRLVMCVDNSGSMSGPKIMNSIKYLNEIAREFNITTEYYRFGCKVDKISGYSQSTLPCDDGTRVQDCLYDLFNNHLRSYTSSKTKFIFVTDAEDSVTQVSGLISAKRSCETAYGNKLHSYCLLTGYGSCANELQQVFGANSFDHVTDNKFKTILQKITGGVKIANKVSKISMDINKELQLLTQDNNAEIRAFGTKMNDILNTVNDSKQKTQAAQQKIDTVKTNLSTLNTKTTNTRSQVNSAYSDREVDEAEDAVNSLKSQYRKEGNRLDEAGKLLDESATALQGETTRADDIAKKLEENGDKISSRAKAVITNIIASIKELNQITSGSYEQVKELKSKFTKDLDDLMEIVKENKNLQTELETVQKSIQSAFKDYKRGRTELDGFKQNIENQMAQLNQLLDVLDSR